ncbi:MAG: FkbM family methyltransferase [Cytophagales bacterium]|nr:FkbM family methyltransferase [Cytophagales bacterium]
MKLRFSGFLYDKGWLNSYVSREPLNRVNEPIPWVTYSFIDFIEDRLRSHMRLMEFGSGNSTLYYSKRVAQVTAVEHDGAWCKRLKDKILPNVQLLHCELVYGGDYARMAKRTGGNYDIIIVDGRDRVNCVSESIEALNESGVVVLDDSERREYEEVFTTMEKHGFKRLDLWGFAPGVYEYKCTTIFYRSQNILGI